MNLKIYNFDITFDWELMNLVSQLDRFDASWSSLEKKEGKNLNFLKHLATIKSVGASTRIEGSNMTDEDVENFLNDIKVDKFEERDTQEVRGYYDTLALIEDVFSDIDIKESHIQNLHNVLLKHSKKDQWHKGSYKTHTNAVEATLADGSKHIIFRTTEAGIATDDAMRNLVEWYNSENKVHSLLKIAAFVYDFLSIHPFQDGNGRLSRLLTTLLLMKCGYQWVQYISFEHEIENNKKDYYKSLRNCQAQRPNENITEWIIFFLRSLHNVQQKLEQKLVFVKPEKMLLQNEKKVYAYITKNIGAKSGEIAENTNLSASTVKRILSELVTKNLIQKHGKGAGTNYSIIA